MDDIQGLVDMLYGSSSAIGKTGKKFDQLAALSTRGNLRTIEQLMRRFSAERTLEIGMAFGGSTVTFAAMHRVRWPNGENRHVAIDPFQSTVWDSVGKLKLEEACLAQFVSIIEQPSSIALPRLLAEGSRFGIIYVDGSHLFEDVFVDAYFAMRLMEDGGYLLFDDSTDPHVAKVLAWIDASMPGLERQPETTLKQSIARYLGKRQLTIYRRIGSVDREWNTRFKSF